MAKNVEKTTPEQPPKKEGGITGKGFKPGQSGNPAGRPKGTVSVVEALRRKLEEVPNLKENKEKRTYLELLIAKMLQTAIVKGDVSMIRDIVNRVDGMPRQTVEVTDERSAEIDAVKATLKKLTLLGKTKNDRTGKRASNTKRATAHTKKG